MFLCVWGGSPTIFPEVLLSLCCKDSSCGSLESLQLSGICCKFLVVCVTKVDFLFLENYLLKVKWKEIWWGDLKESCGSTEVCCRLNSPGIEKLPWVIWFSRKGRRVNACRFWNETRLVGCRPNKTRILKSLKHIQGKKGTEVCGGINEGFITKPWGGQVLFVWDEKWKDWSYCKWMHGRSKSILFCQSLRTAAWYLLWLLLTTQASCCDRSKAILISTFTIIYIWVFYIETSYLHLVFSVNSTSTYQCKCGSINLALLPPSRGSMEVQVGGSWPLSVNLQGCLRTGVPRGLSFGVFSMQRCPFPSVC